MPALIRIDRKGLREALNTDAMRVGVTSLAKRLASATESVSAVTHSGAEVEVSEYRTDRVAAAVTIKDPRAKGLNAKYGVFNQAASSLGGQIVSK